MFVVFSPKSLPEMLTVVAQLLTLGAHAQRGFTWSVCLSVCVSVTTFFATVRNKAAKKRYQRVQRYTGFILKMVIFVKILSKVMPQYANEFQFSADSFRALSR